MLSAIERRATQHKNVLGAGAEARKHLRGKSTVKVVIHEFKKRPLHSGSGDIVTNPKQAIAIALSEAGLSSVKRKLSKFKKPVNYR